MKKTQNNARWLKFLSLIVAFIALAVPKAEAWVFYCDVSNTDLDSSPHLHVGNSGGWYSNYTGTLIAPNVYKFSFDGWGDLYKIAFTKTNTSNNPGGDTVKWGDFTTTNGSSNWKAESGSCYTLNSTYNGATRTASYSEPTKPYFFDGTAHAFSIGETDWEYTLDLSNSDRLFRLQNTNSTTALGTQVNNIALCPSGASWDSEWEWTPGTSSMSVYTNYKGKLKVGPGAYKISINTSLNSVTLTKTASAGPSLSEIQYQKGSYTGDWIDISSTTNLSDISGNYYFRALYDNDTFKYLSVNEINKDGSYSFTDCGITETASTFASNVSSASIQASSTDNLTVSSVVYKNTTMTFYVNNSKDTDFNKIYIWYTLNSSDTKLNGNYGGQDLGTSTEPAVVATAVAGKSNEWKYVVTYPQGATLKMIVNKNGSGNSGNKTADIEVANGTLYSMSSSDGSYTTTADYTPVTLTSVSISKDNGANWTEVTNNSTITAFSGLLGTEHFLVKSTWSDEEVVYFTFDGTPGSDGTKNLKVTTASNGGSLNSEVVAANMLVNVTSKTAATITLSGVTTNVWTFTPANNTVTTDKSITVSKTDSRGNTVSYGYNAINAAGTYVLTEGGTSPVVINIDNPSTTIIWTDGVPTLKVADLNAGIVEVWLKNRYNNNEIALTKRDDAGTTVFTWTGTIDQITNDNKTEWAKHWYLKGKKADDSIVYGTLPSSDVYWLGQGSASLTTSSTDTHGNTNSSNGCFAFSESSNVSVTVSLKTSNLNEFNKIYRGIDRLFIVGGIVGKGYDEGDGINMYVHSISTDGKAVYKYDCGTKKNDQYCRFYTNGNSKGHATTGDGEMSSNPSSPTSWDSNSNTFKVPVGSEEKEVTIWVIPSNDKVWFTKSDVVVIIEPNFKVKDHEYDHVFITAPYLNDSKIAPDWEMSTKDGITYTLKNVTLRGASKVNPELTAVVINNTTNKATYYKWTPTTGDLENSNAAQVGRSFDLTFTNNGASSALTGTAHADKSIPFISLVGYRYQQSNNEDSPHNIEKNGIKGTARGWQESWILYDENGDPFRDNDGKYMYSTQWPPKYPIHFAGVKDLEDHTKDIEMSSDNLIFHRRSCGTTPEGDPIYKLSGAKWKNYGDFQNVAYDGLTGKDHSAASAPMRTAAAADGSLTDGTDYTRFTINNVWVLGSTKIWTGWGSQLAGTAAEWGNNVNWGFSDKSSTDDAGTEISSQSAYKMVNNAGNFLFDQPTFFKTVELFVPTNADGTVNLSANPIFYTTLGKGDPSILARSAKLAGSEKVPNTGTFFAAYDTGKLPTGTTISKVVITRYDGNESSSDNDPSNWKKLAVVKTYTSTGDDPDLNLSILKGNNSFRSDVDNASAVWFKETEDLPNGRYFYGMALYDGSDNLIEQVASNTFSIANIEITPSVNALQLLELTEAGANLVDPAGEIISSFSSTAGNRWYLTYQPDNAGKFFIVQESTNKVFEIEKEDAMKAINAYEVVWTTRYFVRAGNVSSYNATMTAQKNKGIISHFTTPTYSVSYTDKTSTLHDVPQASMVQSSNGTVGFVTNFTEGMLDKFTFQSSLTYKVTPTGETQLSYTNNGSKPVLPYVPGAYKLSYDYESDYTVAAAFADGITMTTTSSIIANNEGVLSVGGLGTGNVPTSNACEKTMSVKGLQSRDLNCVFKFARPNVSKAILDNYDIFYDLWLNNNDPDKDIFKDRIFVDDATNNTQGEKFYKVTVHQVSPANDIYPEMAIKGTVYIPHGKLSEIEGFGEYSDFTSLTDDQKAKVAKEVERVRKVTETSIDSKFQMYHTPAYEVRKLPLKNNADAGTASDWYTGSVLYCEGINTNSYDGTPKATLTLEAEVEWIQPTPGDFVRQISYKLKTDTSLSMSDTGDIIHTSTTGDRVVVTPSYYDIETYVPEMVSNLSLDASNNITGTNYYDKAGIFVVNPTTGDLASITNNDRYVAKNFVHEPNNKPATFIITPIYIFRRQPAAAVDAPTASQIGLILIGNNVADQYDTNEGEEPVAAASAPRRASGSSGMASSVNSVGGVEYVVMRGSAALNDTAGVGDGVWTSVEMVEDSGLLTIGRGRIAIDGAKSARIFNMSGINVGEGNGVHYVEPGIYTVLLNGNPRKVVVK